MTREGLIAYDRWLTENKWGSSEIITPEQAADLYLAKHPLPPAEGAVPDNAAEQNKRMREWFKERTGLDDTLLSIHMEQIDVMLKGVQQQPTAEGAEEILKKHMNGRAVQEYKEELFIEYNTVVAAMQDFATLHAQRLAEKMVEERSEFIKKAVIRFFYTEVDLNFCTREYRDRVEWYFNTYQHEIFKLPKTSLDNFKSREK